MSETNGPQGHVHRYHATCHWAGDTAMGYESYDRAHTSSAPPVSTELMLSADRAFLGHPQKLNPEQLLLVSASSCQLLSFWPSRPAQGFR
jgi:organic hydroperoxide reductase OsmC/OhrA